MDIRSLARLAAVQSIYEKLVNEEAEADGKFNVKLIDEKRYNTQIFNNILEHVSRETSAIDELISANMADNWKIERLPYIMLAILRAGIAEAKYMDAPKNIILSEYVAIADQFLDDDEVKFVNALLDKAA